MNLPFGLDRGPLRVALAVWLAMLLIAWLVGCVQAPKAIQLPESKAQAAGVLNKAESTQDTFANQPTGIASPAVPVSEMVSSRLPSFSTLT